MRWQDTQLKALIANVGTTDESDVPHKRTRHRVVEDHGVLVTETNVLEVKRPCMIELFFRHFGAVDVYDHYRQGSLALELHWSTHTWWHRMFATMLGVTVTNAFFAYKFDCKGSHTVPDSYADFVDKLVSQMLKPTQTPADATRSHAEAADARDIDHGEPCFHQFFLNFLKILCRD
jgi:hypothetical protein